MLMSHQNLFQTTMQCTSTQGLTGRSELKVTCCAQHTKKALQETPSTYLMAVLWDSPNPEGPLAYQGTYQMYFVIGKELLASANSDASCRNGGRSVDWGAQTGRPASATICYALSYLQGVDL